MNSAAFRWRAQSAQPIGLHAAEDDDTMPAAGRYRLLCAIFLGLGMKAAAIFRGMTLMTNYFSRSPAWSKLVQTAHISSLGARRHSIYLSRATMMAVFALMSFTSGQAHRAILPTRMMGFPDIEDGAILPVMPWSVAHITRSTRISGIGKVRGVNSFKNCICYY